MGVESHREGQQEVGRKLKTEGLRLKARRAGVGAPGFLTKISLWLDKANERLDRSMEVAEYTEILVDMQQRLHGDSEPTAASKVSEVRKANPEEFIGRAVDLFNYRWRITQGDGAITVDTFQHCLDADPWNVLEDSRRWADVYAEMNSAICDWAHTVPLVAPNDSAL